MQNASDAEQFHHWLENSNPDSEKRKRLTCQYNLLRYIQQVGDDEAFNKIITLVDQDQVELFKQLMDNYTNLSLPKRKLTFNGNEIHSYINQLYDEGKLDSDVINILVRRQILYLWQGNHQIHLDLLLPMCYILIKWDNSITSNTNCSCTVTFNEEMYNPFELVDTNVLPLLDQLINLDKSKRKGLVLGCVDFALRSKENQIDCDGIHRNYKLWFCLLKLSLNMKTNHSNSLKMTLMALIISFLKHAFLDTYDETEGKYHQYKHL